jgi:hypothetical protein
MNSNATSRSAHSSSPSRFRAFAFAHLFALAPLFLTADTFDPYTYEVSGGHATIIGCHYAYSGALSIPDKLGGYPVTAIGDYAFYGCASLTSVTIPDSVTTIGWRAFGGCASLTSVTIPDSVTTIGWGAFGGCASLTSVTIPGNVTDIGDYAFDGCTALTAIDVSKDNANYVSDNGVLRQTLLDTDHAPAGSPSLYHP